MERLPRAFDQFKRLVELPDGQQRVELIEEICRDAALELRRQELSSYAGGFLLPHGESVLRGVRDPILRRTHIMEE